MLPTAYVLTLPLLATLAMRSPSGDTAIHVTACACAGISVSFVTIIVIWSSSEVAAGLVTSPHEVTVLPNPPSAHLTIQTITEPSFAPLTSLSPDGVQARPRTSWLCVTYLWSAAMVLVHCVSKPWSRHSSAHSRGVSAVASHAGQN